MVNSPRTELLSVSVTCRVKLKSPKPAGTPPIDPSEPSVRPGASEPETMDHVYGGRPPVAKKVKWYPTATQPIEREGPFVMVISIAVGITFSEVKARPLARIPSPKRGTSEVNDTEPRVPAMPGNRSPNTSDLW